MLILYFLGKWTKKIIERLDNGGKGGIIWHTQGSGKTALSAYASKVIREYYELDKIEIKEDKKEEEK